MINIDVLFGQEFVRFYLVFIHTMAATLAVGSILFSYIEFFCNGGCLNRKKTLLEHTIVTICFLVLVASGVAIVYIDVGVIQSFTQLFLYKKLTAKLMDVLILLCNGLFIHGFIIPRIQPFSTLSRKVIILFGASAGLSTACWINAIFLGKAKVLASIMNLNSFLMMNLLVAFFGLAIGIISSFFLQVKIQ